MVRETFRQLEGGRESGSASHFPQSSELRRDTKNSEKKMKRKKKGQLAKSNQQGWAIPIYSWGTT